MSAPHGTDSGHATENYELLDKVRDRLRAATFARELLPDYASLGEILALAEWLLGGTGVEFLDPDPTTGGRR